MEKLIEGLLNSLENGNWVIAVIIIFITAILNIRSIQDFFHLQNRRHEEFIKEALKIDAINDAAKKALIEQLNYIVYKRVTGIAADSILRSKIQILVEDSQGELRTADFTKAQKFIEIRSGRASIKITKWDKVENWFNKVSAVIMLTLAVLTIFLTTTIPEVSLPQIFTLGAVTAMVFGFALFLVTQTVPMTVAKRIAPVVKRLEDARLGQA